MILQFRKQELVSPIPRAACNENQSTLKGRDAHTGMLELVRVVLPYVYVRDEVIVRVK